MPFNTDTLKRHYDTHLQDLPCTVVVAGITTSGSKGSNIQSQDDYAAGVSEIAVFPVWIGNDDVTAMPVLHSLVSVDGREYRISRVEEYADGNGWRMDLVAPEQPNM